MSLESFYSLDALIERAEVLVDGVDTVTMDLFDTLFIRRIHDPDLVKFPVCEYIAKRARAMGLTATRRGVWRARWEIEREHRARHGKSHPDHEACYPEFMGETLDRVFGEQLPSRMLEDVTDFELLLETAVIVPRAALVEWLRALKERGKRVFLVSDIYLPAEHLRRLVEAQGLTSLVEDVVSSADSFRAKASGAAFPLLQERFGLDPQRWLHVGDNPISDGIRPAEFGLQALVLHDAGERHRKGITRCIHGAASRSQFWKGRYVHQLMLPLEGENQVRDPLYVEGYSFYGLLLANFVHRFASECKRLDIRRVYFCSREGWTFQRIWDALVPYLWPDGDAPDARYLYVSRRALAPTACANEGLAPLDTTVAMLPAGSRDIRDICRVFGLDLERLRPAVERVGLQEDDPIGPMTPGVTPELRRRFGLLLEDPEFQAEVKRQTVPSRQALERYLESEDFFGPDEVAIVDIGWLGTIQHYLLKALSHRADVPRVHGFLLGATRHVPYDGNSPNFHQYARGLLYDAAEWDVTRRLVTGVKDVFEEVCRGPHPTLMAYRPTGPEGFELEFRRTDDETALAEKQQSQHFHPLRQGILDAAARYGAAVATLEYEPERMRPWINFLMLCKLAYPRTSEIARIRHKAHQDEFAGTHKVASKFLRKSRTLWDRSLAMLRFNPFIRTYYYLRGGRDALRSGP